jgi:hypothetical protein
MAESMVGFYLLSCVELSNLFLMRLLAQTIFSGKFGGWTIQYRAFPPNFSGRLTKAIIH